MYLSDTFRNLDQAAAKVPKHAQIWSITGRGGSDGFAFYLAAWSGRAPEESYLVHAGLVG